MKKDVFEKKNLALYDQLKELKEYIIAHGTAMGFSNTEIARIVLLCDEYRAKIMAVINKKKEFLTEAEGKKSMKDTHLTPLRKYLHRMKNPTPGNKSANLPNFKSRITKPDHDTYKPKLRTDINKDMIRVKFKKLGAEQMEFWGSCNGGDFHHIGSRAHSPFFYKPEELPGNAPQKWDIKAIGLVKDKQFGQWSDKATVLYASGLGE